MRNRSEFFAESYYLIDQIKVLAIRLQINSNRKEKTKIKWVRHCWIV